MISMVTNQANDIFEVKYKTMSFGYIEGSYNKVYNIRKSKTVDYL